MLCRPASLRGARVGACGVKSAVSLCEVMARVRAAGCVRRAVAGVAALCPPCRLTRAGYSPEQRVAFCVVRAHGSYRIARRAVRVPASARVCGVRSAVLRERPCGCMFQYAGTWLFTSAGVKIGIVFGLCKSLMKNLRKFYAEIG